MRVLVTLFLLLLATFPGYFVIIFMGSQTLSGESTLPVPLNFISQFFEIVSGSSHTPAVIGIQLSLILMGAFALLLSAAMSSLVARTSTATALSYAVLGVICIGTMLVRFAEDAPFSHQTVEAVLTINPLAAALTQIKAPMFTDYPSVAPVNRWMMLAGCAICLAILVGRTRALTKPR